jgi:hypothetical protein
MKMSHSVANKIASDPDLLSLLKTAAPQSSINRGITLVLSIPDTSQKDMSKEEEDAWCEDVRRVGEQAQQEFSAIRGLEIHYLMKNIGMASVRGTAEALVKAIELNCVNNAFISDRLIFRGTTRG